MAIQMVVEHEISCKQVAHELHLHVRTVEKWVARFREDGEKALVVDASDGRPPKLDQQQREQLKQALLECPTKHGFATQAWTCPRVGALIKQLFDVQYHPDHVSKLLRKMGMTRQKPVRRAIERDDEAIDTWVCKDWPRIQKKPNA